MSASRAETVLRMNNWLPPGHSQLVGVLQPWAKSVGEATRGRVKVVLTDTSLGAPPRQYDLAVDGIADVTLAIGDYTPGRFKLTPVGDLPLISEFSEPRAVATWRTYKKFFEKADEFKGVQLMGIYHSAPGSILTTREPVTDLASYKGKKMRVGGGVMDEVNVALGGVSVSAPANSMYQILQQGVADGALIGGEGYNSFKLSGLIKYATRVPGGMYASDWYIVMNKATWNKLPKEDQDAIMSVSGEAIARLGGGTFDKAEAVGRDQWIKDGMKVIVASPEFQKTIFDKTAFIKDQWVKQAAAMGIDGAAALAYEIEQAKAEEKKLGKK
ncbi:MAG: TRAP transporter substrate-binding protein [Pseudorhodoplanes sp.]